MTDTCDFSDDRCDNSALKDPCSRETPLFNNADPLTQFLTASYAVSTQSNDDTNVIAFEAVFDSLFIIWKGQMRKIYRLGGPTYDALIATLFVNINSNDGIDTFVDTKTINVGTIETICSMDFYGLFIGMTDEPNTSVVRLEINIEDDGANPPTVVTDANGLYNVDSVNYYEMDLSTTGHYRLLQTKGYYSRHRPCYVVLSEEPT